MKFYDLFAGIGGFRLGMERVGHECVGSCEIDKYARIIYTKHFEEPYPDARKLQTSELSKFDILTAGFPCQAFSIAGKRKGFNDTRGIIFFEIARIAKECKPTYLFLENVRGLLSHQKGKTFQIILETLDDLGYDVEWQVLNTKYFIPQNRERVFIIGHLRGEYTRKIFPLGIQNKKNGIKSNKKQERRTWISTLDSRYGERWSTETYVLTERRTEKAKQIRREYRKSGKDFSPRREKELVPRNDGLSNCLTSEQTKEHYLYNDRKIRRLTPIECERLQGFPDGWTEGISDTQRYKCLGNAVSVPVVEYIGKNILK